MHVVYIDQRTSKKNHVYSINSRVGLECSKITNDTEINRIYDKIKMKRKRGSNFARLWGVKQLKVINTWFISMMHEEVYIIL